MIKYFMTIFLEAYIETINIVNINPFFFSILDLLKFKQIANNNI